MRKLLNRGLYTNRFKTNPEERRFAEAWDAVNALRPGPGHVHTLLALLGSTTNSARVVAATVVQWFGSPEGSRFLAALGYEKVRNGPTGLIRFERTPEGHINNCALANNEPEGTCQICNGKCPDRSKFK